MAYRRSDKSSSTSVGKRAPPCRAAITNERIEILRVFTSNAADFGATGLPHPSEGNLKRCFLEWQRTQCLQHPPLLVRHRATPHQTVFMPVRAWGSASDSENVRRSC